MAVNSYQTYAKETASEMSIPNLRPPVVPILASTYYLNASKSKRVTIALDCVNNFQPVVMLENAIRPSEVIYLSPEEWDELTTKEVEISTYLTSPMCGVNETIVAELRLHIVTVSMFFNYPTVIVSRKNERGAEEEENKKKKKRECIALQCGSWGKLMQFRDVIAISLHQHLMWSFYCNEYFKEFINVCKKELRLGSDIKRVLTLGRIAVADYPPESLNIDLFTAELKVICKEIVLNKLS